MSFKDVLKLVIAVAVCQAAGLLGSLFTTPAIPVWYAVLHKPAFAPPNWVFGPVWIALFVLMAVAAFLVWRRGWGLASVRLGLGVFAVHLVLNVAWSACFFGLRSPGAGFAEIVVLWLAIVATMVAFGRVSRAATALLVPYILWVSFAAALNYRIFMLNR